MQLLIHDAEKRLHFHHIIQHKHSNICQFYSNTPVDGQKRLPNGVYFISIILLYNNVNVVA
jgi:hypothetical protein